MKKITVIAVVGPTASGKTSLSIEIAKHFSGQVVSADSMQIYKKMNIATAKPTDDEMQGIPHPESRTNSIYPIPTPNTIPALISTFCRRSISSRFCFFTINPHLKKRYDCSYRFMSSPSVWIWLATHWYSLGMTQKP